MALNLERYKILIVDNVREMRTSLRGISKSLGAQTIYEAKSGAEAIEQLQTHDVDIVLSDYMLGAGRDGLQVFEEAKEFGMIAPHAAYIIITAEDTKDVVMAVVEHSPDDYLVKPLHKAALEVRLEKVLHRKRVFKEIEAQTMAGNFAKAAAICDLMVGRNAELHLDLLHAKAEALIQAGDAEHAAELSAGILVEQEVPWATVCMGRASYLMGNIVKARLLFEKAIKQDLTLMEAYDRLVHLDRETGEPESAQKTLQQAVELSPKSIRRHQLLADLAVENGDYETAREAFEAAVDLGIHSCFSRVDDQVGFVNAVAETRGAEAALEVLIELSDSPARTGASSQAEPDWRLDLSHGEILLANERAVDAKTAIEKALKGYRAEPHDTAGPSVIALAQACYAVGMTVEAQTLMDRIVRENHDRDDILTAARDMFSALGLEGVGNDLIENARRAVIEINNRGVQLAKERKLDDAVDLLAQASDELPGNLTITLNVLRVILSQMGETGYTNQRQYMINEYIKRAERIDARSPKLAKMRENVSHVRQMAEQQVVA